MLIDVEACEWEWVRATWRNADCTVAADSETPAAGTEAAANERTHGDRGQAAAGRCA